MINYSRLMIEKESFMTPAREMHVDLVSLASLGILPQHL